MITTVSDKEIAQAATIEQLRQEVTAWSVTAENLEAERDALKAQEYPPAWRGYALLGSGNYVINHSRDFDNDLGAELIITFATEADRAGNRQIGESRMNPTDVPPIQAKDMVIRIGFLSERGLFALEEQLQFIRDTHFSESTGAVKVNAAHVYKEANHD